MGEQTRLTVITGEPSLPDETRRGGANNEEDHATHAAMRAALASFDEYAT